MLYLFYSPVLRATTGSLFAAIIDGNNPAIKVKIIEIAMSAKIQYHIRIAKEAILVNEKRMILIGIMKSNVIPTPTRPAENPIISVSALNTFATSFFDAPKERSTPISFVRSMTET